MKNQPNQEDEFYIGYLPGAPEKTAVAVRWIIVVLLAFFSIAAIALSYFQRPFSKGRFEFGLTKPVSGIYFSEPVPHLVHPEKQSITLLVGYGKAGALTTMRSIGNALGISLEGVDVTLVGTKIYDQGKDLLQITVEDNRALTYSRSSDPPPPLLVPMGMATFSGEVVDPKCYFGVMKPGEGKPHRSCAIRCISGGIPPVLLTRGENPDHVILDGDNINQEILSHVGEPIVITGKLYQYRQWKIMKADQSSMETLAREKFLRELLYDDRELTQCGPVYRSMQ